MNFSEKIKKIRKQYNLTQEEFADKLYVSRTAVSKWESGKGYPSIDLLKQISEKFNISIDNLLSSDEAIELAEEEKKDNSKKINNLIFSVLDLSIIFLLFLPLYSQKINNYIYSVPLFTNTDIYGYTKIIYLVCFLLLFVIGIVEFILSMSKKNTNEKINKTRNDFNIISLIISFITILFCIETREAYVSTIILILFMIKVIMLLKNKKQNKR